ncbi:S1 family peptidase [Teredinibacter haidensis]|uniref:S1 family peptidase n=1 Tax=Teredinibacter haidensis TaxID=2731755 RepID=UPI000948B440|nr:serine protease [Teredinibacter haidensis]
MRIIVMLLCVFVLGCTTAGTQVTCSQPGDVIKQAVVQIRSGDYGFGSGVVIGDNMVITVAHTIDKDESVYVHIDGEDRAASILSIDKNNDLALLSVDTKHLKPVQLKRNALQADEMVWVLGYPLASSQKLSLGLYKEKMNGRLYTTSHVNHGTSGGGLLACDRGQYSLAGVVHGFVARIDGGDYVNIGDSTSVPANIIEEFIWENTNRLASTYP